MTTRHIAIGTLFSLCYFHMDHSMTYFLVVQSCLEVIGATLFSSLQVPR